MALVNRKKQQQQPDVIQSGFPSSNLNLNSSSSYRHWTSRGVLFGEYESFLKSIVLALVLSPIVYYGISNRTLLIQKGSQLQPLESSSSSSSSSSTSWQIQQEQGLFALRIDFATGHDLNGNKYNSLGPHVVTLKIMGGSGGNKHDNDGHDEIWMPQVWTRIVGDALVNVPLVTTTTSSSSDAITKDSDHSIEQIWTGQFHVPLAGSYRLEAMWRSNANLLSETRENNVKYYDFHVMGNAKGSEKKIGDISLVQGSWIAATKIIKDDKEMSLSTAVSPSPSFPYMWADPLMGEKGNAIMTNIFKGNNDMKTVMLKESTVTAKYQFYDFQKLSNYELVCWIGSQSAQDIWESFKTLRGNLFPHQRPFKFHYYKATSFIDPDKDWRDNTAFRKCKHILISLDEPEKPLSKVEYKEQLTTFVKHLLNAFDEEHTFPALIWMFTTMESSIDTRNCYEDDNGQGKHLQKERSTRHPCNEILLDLFQNNSPFPSRVRLLDNTDLTDPIWTRGGGGGVGGGGGGEDGRHDVATAITMAIALRIYVIVGHQVKIWRDAGQEGGIHGLTRNGVTQPNFELVRYDWSQEIH